MILQSYEEFVGVMYTMHQKSDDCDPARKADEQDPASRTKVSPR